MATNRLFNNNLIEYPRDATRVTHQAIDEQIAAQLNAGKQWQLAAYEDEDDRIPDIPMLVMMQNFNLTTPLRNLFAMAGEQWPYTNETLEEIAEDLPFRFANFAGIIPGYYI